VSTKQYEKKGMPPKATVHKKAASHQRKYHGKSRGFRTGVKVAVFIGVALILLGIVYMFNTTSGSPAGSNLPGRYTFAVGSPGPGEQAPSIRLQSTDGRTFDLAALRGKTVLLFFQEGIACEPCWTQIRGIESHMQQFRALGIDTMVSITSDPLDTLKQKVADEGLSTPVLSDPGLAVSRTYYASQYGMMGGSSNGHTFIVVGPDGRIKWRADFGGAPNYTMYVPVSTLVTDLKEGLHGKV
jgi:peroxiredoxin Q/BCP